MRYLLKKSLDEQRFSIQWGRLFFMTCILCLGLFFPAIGLAADESKDGNDDAVDIQSYVSDMQPGWNLGNTFDAVGDDETAWGNPYVTKDLIENIAGQGYNSIRIPVTFDERMLEDGDYTIDSDFLDRVDQAIQWALEEDMYVMINVHHDSWTWIEAGMQENHDETLDRYRSIWTQLSEHFKDYSMNLMFESINEPRFWGSDSEQEAYLDELNIAFHQIVRESGGLNDVRPLVLPTLDTGSESEKLDALYATIDELDDPNLISTVHFYGFWPFSVNVAGHTTFDDETKQDIIDTFDRVHDAFVAKGIPVIIGEYGLLGFDTDINAIQQGEKLKFFEYMLHYAQEKDLTHMLWDNGQHFGRQSFTWSDPALYEMMKTSWETRSATAESDHIYLKMDEAITDVDVELNLHGNKFQALQIDGNDLEEGEDYTLNGDVLTIKSDLLSNLDNLNEIGVKAVLTLLFDKGVDWDMNVMRYDTVTLEDVDGEAGNFAIPTNFNGDHLATMEAVDNNGEPVGPQDWTPFKEFAYTFSPNYDAHEIGLKEAFFNEVDDGEIDLTFHFWSGETIDYTLLKEGDNIIGTNGVEETMPSTDTSALTELIEMAESHLEEEGKYTQDSLAALKVAIESAEQVIEQIDSEEALKEEIASLQAAIDGLQEIEYEKEVLVTPDISNGKATIASGGIENLASNGQFIVDMRDTGQIEDIFLLSDQVRALIERNADIIVKKSGVTMTLPASILNDQADVVIRIEQLYSDDMTIPKEATLVGTMYDVTITQAGTLLDRFDDDVTLSFVIDENKVNNTDKVHVFYLESDTNEWFDLGGDYEEGIITVTTDHLSVFAVMEKIDEPRDGKDDTTQSPSDDQHEDRDDNPAQKSEGKKLPDTEGERLPETGTSMYTLLLIGAVLLGLGAVALIVKKRRQRTDV